ncbi:hypothetical protein MMC07_000277 [Pseudocyphellaria aurata]|nr:hypothetical protein [Pseudocyphellaria aurata]
MIPLNVPVVNRRTTKSSDVQNPPPSNGGGQPVTKNGHNTGAKHPPASEQFLPKTSRRVTVKRAPATHRMPKVVKCAFDETRNTAKEPIDRPFFWGPTSSSSSDATEDSFTEASTPVTPPTPQFGFDQTTPKPSYVVPQPAPKSLRVRQFMRRRLYYRPRVGPFETECPYGFGSVTCLFDRIIKILILKNNPPPTLNRHLIIHTSSQAPRMNTAPFRLTFGVELEFLVRFDPEKCGDELPEQFVCQRITQILNAGGFSAQSYAYTILEWTVTHDGTISDEGCVNNHAIELKSPALEYCLSALQQVSDVVKPLVSKLDLFVNKSCGFHVHVGNETGGFTLRTLKPFGSLITAFEKQLDLLHPLDRHLNGFAKPLYCAFPKDAPPREKMLIIDDLETVDDLIRQFHPVYGA